MVSVPARPPPPQALDSAFRGQDCRFQDKERAREFQDRGNRGREKQAGRRGRSALGRVHWRSGQPVPLPGCVTLGHPLNLSGCQFPQGVFEVPEEWTQWGGWCGCSGGDWMLVLGEHGSCGARAQGRRGQPPAALVSQLILEHGAGLTCSHGATANLRKLARATYCLGMAQSHPKPHPAHVSPPTDTATISGGTP